MEVGGLQDVSPLGCVKGGGVGAGGLQDVSPRIHVTDADFDGLTRGGALCAPGGRLGPAEFEALMREQLQRHTQVSEREERRGDRQTDR